MRHFFSKGTVMAAMWCDKCHAETVWKIAGGRPQYCMKCYDYKNNPVPAAKKKKAIQDKLF